MKLQHVQEQQSTLGTRESFTVRAWQQTLAIGPTPTALHVARVTFEPGARTVWHSHPFGQILIATDGAGRCQVEGGPVFALQPGDSVTIAANEEHWHGAAPNQLFVHISIQAEDEEGNQAIWMEPVSDAAASTAPEVKP